MSKFESVGIPALEKPDQKIESDSSILAEEKKLESVIKSAQEDLGRDKSDTESVKEISSKYIVSEQEKQDSVMDSTKSGWVKYWFKRLAPEVEILPDKIKKIVQKYKEKNKISNNDNDSNFFQEYIEKRIALKRFELKKREEMAKLKTDLRAIDAERLQSPENSKNRRVVYFDGQTQSFYMKDEQGNIVGKNISFGDLIGDYSWGIKYQPDKTVPHKVWRKVRKVLALYEAREKIGSIFNEELSNEYHLSLPTTAIGLDFIDEKLNDSRSSGLIYGTIAERMITEFLTRAQYNNPQLGMKVEKANSLEDAILKYDFKVVVDKKRGIALKSEDVSREQFVRNKKRVGVQFTITKNSGKMSGIKKAQSEVPSYENVLKDKVDEVALVEMPILKTFADLYKKWIQDGKPSGGPEQYLTREQKLEIFKQATKGLIDLSDEELNNLKI